MQKKLLPVLVIAMLIEIWGIYMMGRWIGGFATFLLVIGTAILGAWLIKTEGRKVWQQAQMQMQSGQAPGHKLLEGLCVLVGGILLIVPGFITDIIGITMVIPLTRPIYRLFLYRWLERLIRSGKFTISRGPNRW
ncbi:FxsA family protein [Cohnella mopanensis]|uniref:FxsA family protein n=1 Tax=Cohnella mopanensis TaxID=2911966 RepID=UPI001EF8BBF6|nr:FxsA family protein [Cohnella mopanensis]